MRRAWLLAGGLLALPAVAPAAPPGFGPREYVRETGAPVTVTETFPGCGAERPFRLRVENGPGGAARVSSARVTVNGAAVLGERDVNQQVGVLERTLRLPAENTLTVQLAGSPGGLLRVAVTPLDPCLEIAITSPPPGAEVPAGPLLVRGMVRGGSDVGVTVNGTPALVSGEDFTAYVVNPAGVAELAAVASSRRGETAEARQPITVVPDGERAIRLHPHPPGGLTPLELGFSLSSLVEVTRVVLELRGPESHDFDGSSLDAADFVLARPGAYVATLRATDADGRTHTAATLVEVYDPQALDARLQPVWRDLRDALRAGDLGRALTFMHSHARAGYEELFARLGPTELARIDAYMTAIQLVEAGFGGAEYEMLRERDGETLSFAVWFQLDVDGLWRIRRF